MTSTDKESVDEEIESIQAVYCQPGECKVSAGKCRSREITLQLTSSSGDLSVSNQNVTLILGLSETYPDTLPNVSIISPLLTRDFVAEVKHQVDLQTEHLIGHPMLLDIISLVQENLCNSTIANTNQSESNNSDTADEKDFVWTYLLHLDHMRSKNRYIKTIERWTSELGLTGRLIILKRLILILLQGDQKNLKEYVSRQRTVSVDVDSHGRSCKERMMSVLCEKRTEAKTRLKEFCTSECSNMCEVKDIFSKAALSDLYEENIQTMPGKYF